MLGLVLGIHGAISLPRPGARPLAVYNKEILNVSMFLLCCATLQFAKTGKGIVIILGLVLF